MGAREHPILFGDELVRAILAGTKTQTRRPIKPQPDEDGLSRIIKPTRGPWQDTSERVYRCPFGDAGDVLWVRECWARMSKSPLTRMAFRATNTVQNQTRHDNTPETIWPLDGSKGATVTRWTPSIHMPRWASRITLDVVQVRVERVQDIDEEGARAEGIVEQPNGTFDGGGPAMGLNARTAFMRAWNRIYPGSWERNDWVWCVEFKRAG